MLVNHGHTILFSISAWIATNKIFQNIQTLITTFLWLGCWFHTYTWNLLLTEFSKRFQGCFFPMDLFKNCWKTDLFDADIVQMKTQSLSCSLYWKSPTYKSDTWKKKFLQISDLKPPYQIWRFKGTKRCLPALFDEAFSWTISYQGSPQCSKPCDLLVTFQNLSIHLSKKQTSQILPWSLQITKVVWWKIFTIFNSFSNS